MDNWKKEEVFSKVGPVKNAEEWHNFGLIMVFFFFWFETNICDILYLVFGSVKGHIFDIIIKMK